jgi:hypothetical protein
MSAPTSIVQDDNIIRTRELLISALTSRPTYIALRRNLPAVIGNPSLSLRAADRLLMLKLRALLNCPTGILNSGNFTASHLVRYVPTLLEIVNCARRAGIKDSRLPSNSFMLEMTQRHLSEVATADSTS